MKTFVLRAFSFLAITFVLQIDVRAADTNPPPRLTIELRDGSRVVGESGFGKIKFHSALLGDIKLDVKNIRSVECVSTSSARLVTSDGDTLTVSFAETVLPVKTSFGKVELAMNSVRQIKVLSAGSLETQLINIDFGSGGARGYSLKSGPAAIGQTSEDFWNFYDRDASPMSGDWRRSGTLFNLKLASGKSTVVCMSVSDAAGAWNDESADPMYKTYDYPLDGGNNVVTFSHLPEGKYDILAYSPDGNYEITVNGVSYGVKTTHDSPLSSTPVWREGVQYAYWNEVPVAAGQSLVLTVRKGSGNYAILCGIQISAGALATEDLTANEK
jgi:hypothetical protein